MNAKQWSFNRWYNGTILGTIVFFVLYTLYALPYITKTIPETVCIILNMCVIGSLLICPYTVIIIDIIRLRQKEIPVHSLITCFAFIIACDLVIIALLLWIGIPNSSGGVGFVHGAILLLYERMRKKINP